MKKRLKFYTQMATEIGISVYIRKIVDLLPLLSQLLLSYTL